MVIEGHRRNYLYEISTMNEIFLEPLALFLPNWHRHAFGIIPNLMYICDLGSIIKVIVLYVGYPLNEQLEFLQICIDTLYRQAKADRLW